MYLHLILQIGHTMWSLSLVPSASHDSICFIPLPRLPSAAVPWGCYSHQCCCCCHHYRQTHTHTPPPLSTPATDHSDWEHTTCCCFPYRTGELPIVSSADETVDRLIQGTTHATDGSQCSRRRGIITAQNRSLWSSLTVFHNAIKITTKISHNVTNTNYIIFFFWQFKLYRCSAVLYSTTGIT